MNFIKFYGSLRSRTPEDLADMRAAVQAVVNDREQYKRVLEARGDEAQQCLDALQVLAESPNVDYKLRSSILRMMLHLSKHSGLCPNCLNIRNAKRIGSYPVGAGGFGDVWKGKVDNQLVCLKIARVYLVSDMQKLLKEYMREAIVWQQLHHPNLLPFMGMYYLDKARAQLCLVSPWMERGNLVRYLKDTPRELVDHEALAYDVASGLAHLHDMKIVHGDLKGVNVLMTPEERACIADFGLSRVADTHSLRLSAASTGQARGTTRWLAPELLKSDPPSSVSIRSDMYAYACVCYEIFTGGNIPFCELAEGAVIVAVLLSKKYPSRPSGTGELKEEMWEIMVACWNHEARDRPSAKETCSRVGALHSRKTGNQVQSYPASEWDPRPLAQVRKNVKHPLVDTNAIVRFMQKGLSPGPSLADDQAYVLVCGAEDATVRTSPPPSVDSRGKQSLDVTAGTHSILVPMPSHNRSKSDGNIQEGALVHSQENRTGGGSLWNRLTQWKNTRSNGVHFHYSREPTPPEMVSAQVEPPTIISEEGHNGRNEANSLSKDGPEDSMLADFRDQLSCHLDTGPLSRSSLDMKYPTSSPPLKLQVCTDDFSTNRSTKPATVVLPRPSSLPSTPVRSASEPAASPASPVRSPYRQNLTPSRSSRIRHHSIDLSPPGPNRGPKPSHTASSSEPSLIPARDPLTQNDKRSPASSQHDLASRNPDAVLPSLSRSSSFHKFGSRDPPLKSDELNGDMEARGREFAMKCWNEDEGFLAKDKIAEWLGGAGRINKIALRYYMEQFDFDELNLENAIRELYAKLYVKGEIHQTDRLLEEFSRRYWDQNPGRVYGNPDIVLVVTYSLLLLNADLHDLNPEPAKRISQEQFVRITLSTIQKELQTSLFTQTTTSWNSTSKDTATSTSAISETTQATTPGGAYSSDNASLLGASHESSRLSGLVYGKTWEATMESLLRYMYNSVENQQIFSPLAPPSHSVVRNRSLRRQRSDRLIISKRSNIRGSVMGSRAVVSPYDNSSVGGRASPSPSFTASTCTHDLEVVGSSSSSLSLSPNSTSNFTDTVFESLNDHGDQSTNVASTNIGIADEELALLGPPWAKEGALCRKQYLESAGKRAKDKRWLDVFVVIQKGELSMFSFGENEDGNSSFIKGGGDWLSSAKPVGTVRLTHSLAHVLPPPGYNRQRPHCVVLTLPNGGVYIFQAETEEVVNEWAITCNYWAARTSKEPLPAKTAPKLEYGWNHVNVSNEHGRSRSDGESMDETNTISFKNGKSSRSESSNRKEGVATVRTTQLPLLDRIVINDWKPPKPPSVPSCFDEETQLKALRQHVKSMRRDLRRHNELKEPMSASYQPHSSDAKAAQSNWEKKSRYLLTEIVKYDYYINYLQTAKSLRVKK